jgi:hypothetical protein
MSDSSDALREAVRQADQQAREEARLRNERTERANRRDSAVNALLLSVSEARGAEGTAAFRRVAFDPQPHIQVIAARLKDVLDILRDDGLLARLDDLDCDRFFTHYFRSGLGEYGTAEQARAGFDYARHRLAEVAAQDGSHDELSRELFFDPGFRPAGVWFQLLLRTLNGMNVWIGKEETERANAHGNGAESGNAKVAGRRKRRDGKPPLEQSNPLKFQVYQRIEREHKPGDDYTATVDRLKGEKDFSDQVKAAGLKLGTKLVRNAIAFFDQRERDARKKQETDSA